MYVEDVEDIKTSHNRFLTDFLVEGVKDILQILSDFKALNTIYVEDVEDRSNTSKGCNAMYVEDVEDAYKCVRITM